MLSNSGICFACNQETNGPGMYFQPMSPEECNKCPGYVYLNDNCRQQDCPEGYYLTSEYGCVNCIMSTAKSAAKTKEECENECPNNLHAWEDGECVFASCEDSYFIDDWGICRSCDEPDHFFLYDCASVCPNRHRERYFDDCVPNCESGFGYNKNRCCSDDEVYIKTNTSSYGDWGQCCPKTRPNWDGSKCIL
jgi:hypothetical protein